MAETVVVVALVAAGDTQFKMANGTILTPEQIQQLTQIGALQPETAQLMQPQVDPQLGAFQEADVRLGQVPQQNLEQREPGLFERMAGMASSAGQQLAQPAQPVPEQAPARAPKRKPRGQPKQQPKQPKLTEEQMVAGSLINHLGAGITPPQGAVVGENFIPFSEIDSRFQNAYNQYIAPGQMPGGWDLRDPKLNDKQRAMLMYAFRRGQAEKAQRMQQSVGTEAERDERARQEVQQQDPNYIRQQLGR